MPQADILSEDFKGLHQNILMFPPAAGDGREVSDGAIDAASTTFVSAASDFTNYVFGHPNYYVGKQIYISGAGATTIFGSVLVTTIDAVVDANTLTLHDAASNTVTAAHATYGTDNGPALRAALAGSRSIFIPKQTNGDFYMLGNSYDPAPFLVSGVYAYLHSHQELSGEPGTVLKVADGALYMTDPGTSSRGAMIFVASDADYVWVHDLTVDMNGPNNLTPSDCTSSHPYINWTFDFEGGSYNTVERVSILDNPGLNGIISQGFQRTPQQPQHHFTIRDCYVRDGGTVLLGNDFQFDWTAFYSEADYTIFDRNIIEYTRTPHGGCGTIEVHNSHARVTRNKAYNGQLFCLLECLGFVSGADGIDMEDIVISDNETFGCGTFFEVFIWHFTNCDFHNVRIINNTAHLFAWPVANLFVPYPQFCIQPRDGSGNFTNDGLPLHGTNWLVAGWWHNFVVSGNTVIDETPRPYLGTDIQGFSAFMQINGVRGMQVSDNTVVGMGNPAVTLTNGPFGITDLTIDGENWVDCGINESGFNHQYLMFQFAAPMVTPAGPYPPELDGGYVRNIHASRTSPDANSFFFACQMNDRVTPFRRAQINNFVLGQVKVKNMNGGIFNVNDGVAYDVSDKGLVFYDASTNTYKQDGSLQWFGDTQSLSTIGRFGFSLVHGDAGEAIFTHVQRRGRELTITGASEEVPIVIETSTPHLLIDGDQVIIYGVQGNEGANNTPDRLLTTATVVDSTHFKAENTVNKGTYTGGGTVVVVWGFGGLNIVVIGATNATPIVIETSITHNLNTGDIVQVVGVGGNTAANATRPITVVDPTHFSLNGTVGNGTYVSITGIVLPLTSVVNDYIGPFCTIFSRFLFLKGPHVNLDLVDTVDGGHEYLMTSGGTAPGEFGFVDITDAPGVPKTIFRYDPVSHFWQWLVNLRTLINGMWDAGGKNVAATGGIFQGTGESGTIAGNGAWVCYNCYFDPDDLGMPPVPTWKQPSGASPSFAFGPNFSFTGGFTWQYAAANGTDDAPINLAEIAHMSTTGTFSIGGGSITTNLKTPLNGYWDAHGQETADGGQGGVFQGTGQPDPSTKAGYGAWSCFNAYFDGAVWKQPFGNFPSYAFSSNLHFNGGWTFRTGAANGSGNDDLEVDMAEVFHIDGTGSIQSSNGLTTGPVIINAGYGTANTTIDELVIGSAGSGASKASVCWGDNTGYKIEVGTNITSAFVPHFTISDKGEIDPIITTLTASTPVQTDSSKHLVAAKIDLTSATQVDLGSISNGHMLIRSSSHVADGGSPITFSSVADGDLVKVSGSATQLSQATQNDVCTILVGHGTPLVIGDISGSPSLQSQLNTINSRLDAIEASIAGFSSIGHTHGEGLGGHTHTYSWTGSPGSSSTGSATTTVSSVTDPDT